MKKESTIIVLLAVVISLIYFPALFNFFAQDDFILINQFSQHHWWQDIKNVFGPPKVTHWRPLHNLYFFLAGNLFSKNYVGYHVLTLIFHIGASFLIYKTAYLLLKNRTASVTAGIFYGIHPAHFISLFWISGGATVIGFFFLIAAFYSYLSNKQNLALILFATSLLASEAMIVGAVLFYCFKTLKQRRFVLTDKFLMIIIAISIVFAAVKLTMLTPKTTFDVYQLEISSKIVNSIKYYLLRIAGFAEVSGDQLLSLVLLVWLIFLSIFIIKSVLARREINVLLFSIVTITIGLIPFIFIPSHLSPHYMNVSIFGFSIMIGSTLKQLKPILVFFFLLVFIGIAIFNINLTRANNWVIKRSNLARVSLAQIQKDNPPQGSKLIFADSKLSTSEEAYITLGTGKAIDFWFKDKNYKYCFTRFEICSNN